MNKILIKVKLLYDSMGKSEKKIADWLLEHSEEIIPLSITELAEKSQSSEATIVRFARRMGFSGYQDMKISFAQESGKQVINEEISKDDSCFEILNKISNDIYCSIEMTKQIIDGNALEQAASAISNAKNIFVFGLGNSAPIAADAAHKFMRLGYNATACSDNHIQSIISSHAKKNDVIIGISHSGSSKDIVEALRIAKSSGAATICITNYGKSPIIKFSDIVLCTSSKETEYTILGLNSRIAALAIIDSIYTYLVCRNNSKTMKSIKEAEKALQNKKY